MLTRRRTELQNYIGNTKHFGLGGGGGGGGKGQGWFEAWMDYGGHKMFN